MVILCENCNSNKELTQILKCLNAHWEKLNKQRNRAYKLFQSLNDLIIIDTPNTLVALLEANILETFLIKFCQNHPFAVKYFHLEISKSLKLWNHL